MTITAELDRTRDATADAIERWEAIVIGAGLSGMYALHRLRELGLKVHVTRPAGWRGRHLVLEPLSRRALQFGELDLRLLVLRGHPARMGLDEHFSGQPENLRYCNFVADKFDLLPRHHLRRAGHAGRRGTRRRTNGRSSSRTEGAPVRAAIRN